MGILSGTRHRRSTSKTPASPQNSKTSSPSLILPVVQSVNSTSCSSLPGKVLSTTPSWTWEVLRSNLRTRRPLASPFLHSARGEAPKKWGALFPSPPLLSKTSQHSLMDPSRMEPSPRSCNTVLVWESGSKPVTSMVSALISPRAAPPLLFPFLNTETDVSTRDSQASLLSITPESHAQFPAGTTKSKVSFESESEDIFVLLIFTLPPVAEPMQ